MREINRSIPGDWVLIYTHLSLVGNSARVDTDSNMNVCCHKKKQFWWKSIFLLCVACHKKE